MTCTNCGATLKPGARFCNSCGAPAPAQPTREEIRARVQGGGNPATRNAAPAVRGGAPAPRAQETLGPQHTPLLCLVAVLLGILQLVFLLVKSLYVTLSSGQESMAVTSYSMYGGLRQCDAGFLGVVLVLVTLALLASIAVPMILWGRPKALITAGISALLLILFVIAILTVNKSFGENFLGVKPKLGFWGWVFMLNCLLIPGLVFLAGQMEGVGPAPAAAPIPAAAPAPQANRTPTVARDRNGAPLSRPTAAAAQRAPRRPGVNGPVRPASPARNVTPPDAETIAALRRMAQMHKEGLVSDEEFARIKAECVARGWIRE